MQSSLNLLHKDGGRVLKKIEELGFEVAHIGINCSNPIEAKHLCEQFETAFGFVGKEGNSSFFASKGIEILKHMFKGEKGHIAIKTNNINAAIENLQARGYKFDQSTSKYDKEGNISAIYLAESIGGFAIHLVQG